MENWRVNDDDDDEDDEIIGLTTVEQYSSVGNDTGFLQFWRKDWWFKPDRRQISES